MFVHTKIKGRVSAAVPRKLIGTIFVTYIYWTKVLPEQLELSHFFRKPEIYRKNLRMHSKQAIIHLSKSLNFIFIKCL